MDKPIFIETMYDKENDHRYFQNLNFIDGVLEISNGGLHVKGLVIEEYALILNYLKSRLGFKEEEQKNIKPIYLKCKPYSYEREINEETDKAIYVRLDRIDEVRIIEKKRVIFTVRDSKNRFYNLLDINDEHEFIKYLERRTL